VIGWWLLHWHGGRWWLQWHDGWLVAGKREMMCEEEKIICLSQKKKKKLIGLLPKCP
jgi:hypothetical protein